MFCEESGRIFIDVKVVMKKMLERARFYKNCTIQHFVDLTNGINYAKCILRADSVHSYLNESSDLDETVKRQSHVVFLQACLDELKSSSTLLESARVKDDILALSKETYRGTICPSLKFSIENLEKSKELFVIESMERNRIDLKEIALQFRTRSIDHNAWARSFVRFMAERLFPDPTKNATFTSASVSTKFRAIGPQFKQGICRLLIALAGGHLSTPLKTQTIINAETTLYRWFESFRDLRRRRQVGNVEKLPEHSVKKINSKPKISHASLIAKLPKLALTKRNSSCIDNEVTQIPPSGKRARKHDEDENMDFEPRQESEGYGIGQKCAEETKNNLARDWKEVDSPRLSDGESLNGDEKSLFEYHDESLIREYQFEEL